MAGNRATLRADLSLTSTAFQGGLKSAETFTKSWARRVAALGVVTLVVNTASLVSAVGVVAEFEDQLARVKALTGATGPQFAALGAEAERLGASTRFAASEAAAGQAFLAQAGFSANQIIAETGNVLNLAAAGSLELARAADIASNVFTPFSKNGVTLIQVVDTLAKTASSTNTNVEQLGVAMRQVAPAAAQMGIAVEETAAAIGALGNAGIQAESAGTALRNVLLRLVNPTSEIRQGLETLNLTLKDLDPTSQSLASIFNKVAVAQEKLGNASLAAQANVQIFGVRSAAASSVLASTVQDVEKFTAANLEAAGTAETIARVMNDSLGGALAALRSRFQAVILTINNTELGPELRGFIDDLTASLAEFNADDAAALGDKLAIAFRAAQETAGPFLDVAKELGGVLDATGERVAALAKLIDENREEIAAWGNVMVRLTGILVGIKFASFIAGTLQSTAAIAKQTATNVLAAAQYTRTSIAAVTGSKVQVAANEAVTASLTRQVAAQTAAAASSKRLAALSIAQAAAASRASGRFGFAGVSAGATKIASQTGTKAGQGLVSNMAGFIGGAGKSTILKAIGGLGVGVVGGILAWDVGAAIGKQIDEITGLSDATADLFSRLRGDAENFELLGSQGALAEALSLRKTLVESRGLTNQATARSKVTERMLSLQRELELVIADGANKTDVEVVARENALKVLQQTVKLSREDIEIRQKRTDGIRSGIRLANVQASQEASANKRNQAAFDKILAQRKAIADAKLIEEQETARLEAASKLTANIAASLNLGKDAAAAIAQQLATAPNAGTQTAEALAKARQSAAETLALLRAQAGVKATPEELASDAKIFGVRSAATQLGSTPEAIERTLKLRDLVLEIKTTQDISDAKAVAQAQKILGFEEQIANQKTAKLQNDGRAQAAFELARAEAELTATLTDDRAVQEAEQRRQIIEELTSTYKLSEEEALALANQRLDVERQAADQRLKDNRQDLANRLRIAAAEAGESGQDPDQVRRAIELGDLTKRIASEQELGFVKARKIAEEILRLEEKGQKQREQGLEKIEKASKGIIQRAFSTGGLGSSRLVGRQEESNIATKDAASGVQGFGFGEDLAKGFANRTKGMVNALEKSGDLQNNAAKQANALATAQTQAQSQTDTSAKAAQSSASPLQTLVGLMEKTVENTANTVEELRALRELIGVA